MPLYFIFQFSVSARLLFFPLTFGNYGIDKNPRCATFFSHSPDEHSIFILFLSLFHVLIYCLLRVNITAEKKKMPIKGAENRNAAIHPKIKSTQSTETERYRNGLICEFEYAVRACRKSLCCCFAVSARFFLYSFVGILPFFGVLCDFKVRWKMGFSKRHVPPSNPR